MPSRPRSMSEFWPRGPHCHLGRVLITLLASLSLLFVVSCESEPESPPAPAVPSVVPSPTRPRPTPTQLRAAPATRLPTSPQQRPAYDQITSPVSPAVASRLDEVMAKAAGARALEVKSRVPVSAIPANRLRSYLVERLERERARAEVEKERAVYTMLELLNEDDDLYSMYLGVMSEQIIGMYEFDSREMRLVGTGERLTPLDEMTLAHECIHALQDQHFDLGARLKKAVGLGESALGLQALAEGDATLGSSMYVKQNMSGDQLAALARQSAGLNQDKLRSAPPVLQMNVLFPYVQGSAFVTALTVGGGWGAVDRAFENPPTTSEQILHPEKFAAGEVAVAVKAPEIASVLGSGWTLWKEDTLGELGLLLYLANGLSPEAATKATAGWGGDRMLLFRSGSGYRYALVAVTAWDTPEDAVEFYTALGQLRAARKRGTYGALDEKRMVWALPSRSGYAAISGNRVVFVITPDEATTRKIGDKL